MDFVVGASTMAVRSMAGKLGGLLAQEYTLITGVNDDIQYINDELASIKAFLCGISRVDDHDEEERDWMKQVREVSYDIEDCMDRAGHCLDGKPRGSGSLRYLRKKWYLLSTLYVRHCIATEIGNLKVRAQQVSERRTMYGVEYIAVRNNKWRLEGFREEYAPRDGLGLAQPPRLVVSRPPVGIDDAVKDLEPWFMKPKELGTNHSLRFLAIVGVGGLGKTTLAKTLYHKFSLRDEFSCRASVLASQKSDLPTILRSLLEQFHEQRADASKNDLQGIEDWNDEHFKSKLRLQLFGKRYIILVDDIWSVSALEKIRESLPKGGSVIVTTRFNSVAEACRRRQGKVHKLKPLNYENACHLFHERIMDADPSHDQSPMPNAEVVRRIIPECEDGYLPLAVVLVAGFIAPRLNPDPYSTTESNWEKHIVGSMLWNNVTTEGVTQIIERFYKDLHANLKTCLLYVSMFPKGSEISRKQLMRRWLAEGFIFERDGKTVEEVTEECFSELVNRNLVRAIDNSSNGKVKSCQIHDTVLQYIVSKSDDENFITVVGGHWLTPFPTYKVRRLSVHKSSRQEKVAMEKMNLSHVRSLTVVEGFRALHSTLHELEILQVLDLEGCKDLSVNHLKKVCNMHPLKYLSLRRTDIKTIPSKIARLQLLEVLDIRETKVNKLPASVERLQRMKHLLAGDKSNRIGLKLTLGITKMTALQTLSGIEICGSITNVAMAGTSAGCCCNRQFECLSRCKASGNGMKKELHPFAALENLTSVKKFTIYKVARSTKDGNLSLLSAIEHLSSCSLKFLEIDDGFSEFLDSSLEYWQDPPEHLHTLGLSGMLSHVPEWIGSLQNLEKLTLSLTSLTAETLDILAELPELFSLIFTLDAAKVTPNVHKILQKNTQKTEGTIFVPAGGFKKLEMLRFVSQMLPRLSFLEEAMPNLKRIELRRLRMIEGVYGLENLKNLRQVLITVSSQAPEDAKAKAFQIKELASLIEDGPNLVIDEYNESSKDL